LKKAILIIFIILLIDQISKIYVKTHFYLGETVFIFGWEKAQIYFTQNNGMAWGTEIGGRLGKLFLSIFRLFAVSGIAYWLYKSVKEKKHTILIVSIAFIFAGAVGNILDSLFYGLIFDDPIHHKIATLFPKEGYESMFYGKVVDMFYFPLWHGTFPSWIPKYGGQPFTFFNAIFNVADVAITIGAALLILFNKKTFPKNENPENEVYLKDLLEGK
jgi:signal peptidase II